jgi:hypothetical protein
MDRHRLFQGNNTFPEKILCSAGPIELFVSDRYLKKESKKNLGPA